MVPAHLVRKVVGRLRRWLGTPDPVILMYHRIASPPDDPWQLAVTAENFEAQLQLLQRRRRIVPLAWLAARLRDGRPAANMAAISFDDGYVDVLQTAKPLLERHGCPATIFLPTGFIGRPDGFWWDALTRVFYGTPTLPHELELAMGGPPRRWTILPSASDQGQSRRLAHGEVWNLLMPMSRQARGRVLHALLDWAGLAHPAPPKDRCVTEAEARQLSIPGFIDIGAHTISHPSLPTLAADDLQHEISDSISQLHELLGTSPRGLAYPYGHFDAATVAAAEAAGFAYACTTEGRPATRASSALMLPRLQVPNLSADQFAREVLAHA